MVDVNITECAAGHEITIALGVPAVQLPALFVRDMSFTTPVNSPAFTTKTRAIRMIATGDFQFIVGPAGSDINAKTQPATKCRANVAEYFGVYPGYIMSLYDGTS